MMTSWLHKKIRQGWLALAGAAALSSCASPELPEQPEAPGQQQGLVIDLGTSSITTKATETGDDAYRENTIEKAAVFIFKSDGTRTPGGYKELTFTDSSHPVGVIANGNWKENTDLFPDGPDAAYSLCVVANYHGEANGLSGIQSLTDLKKAMDTDADIWKREGANTGDNETYKNKLFTMTGQVENFRPSEHEDNATVKVAVVRVAAKIRVKVVLAEEFKKKYTPTGYYSNLRNYATKGLLWADREEQTAADERGLSGNEADAPQVEASDKDFQEGKATLLLYTYPNRWGNNALDETFVLLNMPGNYDNEEDPDDALNGQKNSNYYKIPIRLGTDAADMVLNRNTIYQATVTIDRLGQEEIDQPVELNPEFKVAEWTEEAIDIDDSDIRYLELLKNPVIMKNISESVEQYYTSSSKITDVEIANVYYYNKYGKPQTIPDSQYSRYDIRVEVTDPDALSGNIRVTSNVPTNNGIRYILVKIANEQGETAEFLVKQYPLEYITAVTGHFSFRDDFTYGGEEVRWDKTYQRDRWESGAPQTSIGQGASSGWNPTYYGQFRSKVYDTSKTINGSSTVIYYYSFTQRGRTYRAEMDDGRNDDTKLTNPRMYFVRITKTSDKYTLAVPALDAEGYTDRSEANNKLVSPAFMLASQLGAVIATEYFEEERNSGDFNAKDQCLHYVEVARDGTEYRDWRLPTEAELKLIMDFQYKQESVIDEVLAGKYYWAASGKYVTNSQSDSDDSAPAIRCIRDVKAGEEIFEEEE